MVKDNEDNRLSIIIVNYKNYNLTIKCVESVLKQLYDLELQIIILDNYSPNNSYEILRERFNAHSNISIIKSEKNEGFGMGNNLAINKSTFNSILLLNPDVELLDDSIKLMIKKLNSNNDIGILGCKLLNSDLSLQYSCRRFIKLNKFIIARTPLKKLFLKTVIDKINSEYLMLDYDHQEQLDVDWIMGACILFRKDDFKSVGMFSSDYFMYFEDVDICYKMKNYGKRVVYYPKARVLHLHEQESVKKINKLTYYHIQSMFRFYRKYKNNKM